MGQVKIDQERCKECELCVRACNKHCLETGKEHNASGYYAVAFVNVDECNGCGLCAEMCPDMALEVYK